MLKHFMNMENLYEDIPDIMLVLCNALLMAPNESVVELMVSIIKQHLPSNRNLELYHPDKEMTIP